MNCPLPPSWATTPLRDIADVQLGKMLDRKRTAGKPFSYLRNINVRWGHIDTTDVLEMPFRDEELERYSIKPGDVLVCEGGEPGRAAVWTGGETELKYQKALHRVRLFGQIDPRWLAYHLLFDASQGQLSTRFTGTTIKHLPREVFRECEIRLPPIQEQQRILAALDSYLTRLDEAVAGLKRVQRNLERYRASVLQAAVEGRLVPTEAALARAEGRDYEPASVLLERILTERRRRWEEAELEKFRAKGKAPKGDEWKKKYKEPLAPDLAALPALPDGWAWSTVDALAEVKGGITKGQKRRVGQALREVPYLRVANVQRGYLDLSTMKTIAATDAEIDELRLATGDVLFNEGGDRDKLGRGWIWRSEISECIHQNHVFRARIFTGDLLPEFLSWFGNTLGQRYFFDEGKQTTNLASINMTKLRALPVPLPPVLEQRRIRAHVDRLLSISDEVLTSVTNDHARCQTLRQAVLKAAFEGKLVDQDPNDEAADVLLERIRKEREAANARKPAKRTRRKRTRK